MFREEYLSDFSFPLESLNNTYGRFQEILTLGTKNLPNIELSNLLGLPFALECQA